VAQWWKVEPWWPPGLWLRRERSFGPENFGSATRRSRCANWSRRRLTWLIGFQRTMWSLPGSIWCAWNRG